MFRRKRTPSPPATPDRAAVANANALTARWARTHRRGNTVLSGLGCWVLLALLASGANGRARAELESAIGLPAARGIDDAAELLALLHDTPAVHAAYGLWSTVVLDPQWCARLPSGVTGKLNGDPDADQAEIDRWVAEATGGLLDALPLELTSETVLLLASALTASTQWVEPFDERPAAGEGSWAQQALTWCVGSTTDVDRLRIADTDVGEVTLLRVPGSDGVDVHLVRAGGAVEAGAALAAGIASLAAPPARTGADLDKREQAPGVQVERLDSEQPWDHLMIRAPAFTVDASHDLLHHKQVFGLDAASDATQGHFPGISAEPLAVEQANQRVTAEFSATGFRAAAVTAVGMMVGAAPPTHTAKVRRITVSFDEPFGFIATHRASSLVLVAGWVHDPATGADPDQAAR
jgi:serine protease inhibitor